MKAQIYVKHVLSGTMTKSENGSFQSSNPIKINLIIAPDIRMMDLEKVFKELQDKILYWTRAVDVNCLYVVDDDALKPGEIKWVDNV